MARSKRSLRVRLRRAVGRLRSRMRLSRRARKILGWALTVSAVLAIAVAAPLPKPSALDTAYAATFELNVRFAFAAIPSDNPESAKWKALWDAFEKATQARFVGVFTGGPYGMRFVVFYTTSGGTAFFFGQDANGAYALTNAHVIDIDREQADLAKLKTFKAAFLSIVDAKTFTCPNLSDYDEYPSCSMGLSVEPHFADFTLDFAVIKFGGLAAYSQPRLPTIPLGSSATMKAGNVVWTVGAPVGVKLRPHEGQILSARPPYFIREEKWLWVTPFDFDSVGGYSGSPVLDPRTGKAIGMLRGSLLDTRGSGRSVGLFIPMELIARVLIVSGYPVKDFNPLDY